MRNTVLALAGVVLLAGIATGQAWVNGPQSPFAYTRFDAEYFPATAKVYFLGGRIGNATTLGDIYSYTPATGVYADVGINMPRAVSNYDICLLRDDHDLPAGDTWGMYVFGGRVDASPNYIDSVQAYYPVSNTARVVTADPFPGRSGGQVTIAQSAIVRDNKAYVFGGFSSTSGVVSRETWMFDPLAPAGARWTRLPDMLLARAYPIASVVDSFIFACGGDTYDGASLIAKVESQRLNVNNTAAGWTRARDLPRPTDEARGFGFDSDAPHGFAGMTIIAGRGVWSTESAHCFIHDAYEDTFNFFPSLAQRRRNHAGAFIPAEAGGTGAPGMWVWGGRQDSDTNCLRVSEYYPIDIVGVVERPGARPAAVRAWPNPCARVLNFGGAVPAELVDVAGRPVQRLAPGRNDVARLAPGIYFLRPRGTGPGQQVIIQR